MASSVRIAPARPARTVLRPPVVGVRPNAVRSQAQQRWAFTCTGLGRRQGCGRSGGIRRRLDFRLGRRHPRVLARLGLGRRDRTRVAARYDLGVGTGFGRRSGHAGSVPEGPDGTPASPSSPNAQPPTSAETRAANTQATVEGARADRAGSPHAEACRPGAPPNGSGEPNPGVWRFPCLANPSRRHSINGSGVSGYWSGY